jgi:ABC-2 type transport system permease protein
MGGTARLVATSMRNDFISKLTLTGPWIRLAVIMCTNLFSMYFFFVLASYIGNPDISPQYVIIGNMIQSIAVSALYSTANVSGTEKHTGTLESIMSSPAKLFYVFLGKSAFPIMTGFISVGVSIFYAAFLFGVDFDSVNPWLMILICIVTCFSLSGMGLALGSLGVYLRTSIILANVFGYIGLLLCGVNFPISYLPGYLRIFSYAMPLTYSVDAARSAMAGASFASVISPLGTAALLGIIYLGIAWVMFSYFEKRARRDGKTGIF